MTIDEFEYEYENENENEYEYEYEKTSNQQLLCTLDFQEVWAAI